MTLIQGQVHDSIGLSSYKKRWEHKYKYMLFIAAVGYVRGTSGLCSHLSKKLLNVRDACGVQLVRNALWHFEVHV